MKSTKTTVLMAVAVSLLLGVSNRASAQGFFEEVFFGDLQVPSGIGPINSNAWSLPIPVWVEKDDVLHLSMWGGFTTNPATGKKEATSPVASIFYWTPGMTMNDFINARRNGLGTGYKLFVTGDATKNVVAETGAEFKATKPGVVIISLADDSHFGSPMWLRLERFVPVEFHIHELV